MIIIIKYIYKNTQIYKIKSNSAIEKAKGSM